MRSAHLLQQESVKGVRTGHVNTRKELVQWQGGAFGMKAMRENGTTVCTPMPSTAINTINSIQAPIEALQQPINPVADIPDVKPPDEARKLSSH
jgi:hypothetical protein